MNLTLDMEEADFTTLFGDQYAQPQCGGPACTSYGCLECNAALEQGSTQFFDHSTTVPVSGQWEPQPYVTDDPSFDYLMQSYTFPMDEREPSAYIAEPSETTNHSIRNVAPYEPTETIGNAGLVATDLFNITESGPKSVIPNAKRYTSPMIKNFAKARKPAKSRHERNGKPLGRRRTQPRIPPESRKILEQYFTMSCYPENWEYQSLANQAKLPVERVKNWFSNARARKPLPGENQEAKLSSESLKVLEESSSSRCSPPMENFLLEPSLLDGFNVADVERVMHENGNPGLPNMDVAWQQSRPASIVSSQVSSASSARSNNSMDTCRSGTSEMSQLSSGSRARRPGRRRFLHNSERRASSDRSYTKSVEEPNRGPVSNLESEKENSWTPTTKADKIYHCTFCDSSFDQKWTWVRHEGSVHVPQEIWVCCSVEIDDIDFCMFCGTPNPGPDHMFSHGYQTCKLQTEERRTFYRKDQFIQHLHQIHYSEIKHPHESAGCISGDPPQEFGCLHLTKIFRRDTMLSRAHLHCGYCGEDLPDWKERCNHVADHYTRQNLYRSAWWPLRLSIASSDRETWWSCRCLLETQGLVFGRMTCLLCWYSGKDVLQHIENNHMLRVCSQEKFHSRELFYEHLVKEHHTLMRMTKFGKKNLMRPYQNNNRSKRATEVMTWDLKMRYLGF